MATTAARTGAAIAIFRRTARSCAAPRACHAAHRSSKPAGPSSTPGCVRRSSGESGDTLTDTETPTEGFGEGSTRMA